MTALLMSDLEGSIDIAWKKCDWQKLDSTAKCVKHSKWNVAKRLMNNGQKFGHTRTKAWYSLVYATCAASFNDGVGITSTRWRNDGDTPGADLLLDLATTSSAPLHKWTPTPCPFIASGAGESLNQVYKSVQPGEKRLKLTLVQLVRKIIDSAYRSSVVLKDGPREAKVQREKALEKLRAQKGKICQGKYALLLAGLQMLTWRAYQLFSAAVSEGEKHTARVGKWEVWSNYKSISAPDLKYRHTILHEDGVWSCLTNTGKPCWANRIRGLFCSHMCSYAQKIIAGGGKFDITIVGQSAIARHRANLKLTPSSMPVLEQPTSFIPGRHETNIDAIVGLLH